MARIAITKHVQAFLTNVAAQAEAQGGIIEFTDDLAKAFDVAVWKLEQQEDPELYAAWVADQKYTYGQGSKRYTCYNNGNV